MPDPAQILQEAYDQVRRDYGAAIGQRRAELVTPALVLDLGAVQRNIDHMASELKQIGARHQELQADILCKKADIDDMNREIAAHRKRVGNLQTLLADRNEQNQAMMIRIEALYLSRSWRMTGPLRAARRFFSKVTSLSRPVG